jgi:hypothetical protein
MTTPRRQNGPISRGTEGGGSDCLGHRDVETQHGLASPTLTPDTPSLAPSRLLPSESLGTWLGGGKRALGSRRPFCRV